MSASELARTYTWALAELELAYNSAEVAACGSLRCATGDRGVRLHLVADDRLPAVRIAGTNSNNGPLDIFVNTTMVQLVDGTARAFLADALAQRVRASTDSGYKGWLQELFSLGGADCGSHIPVPGRDVPYRQASPEDTLRRSTNQLVLRIVLGHELAHLTNGRRCGVGSGVSNGPSDQLAVEQACDSIAISHLADPRLQQATAIAVPVLAAMHHYERWIAPLYSSGGFDRFGARDWRYRAAFLIRNWQRTCSTASSLPMCEGQEPVRAELVELLDRATPKPCTPGPQTQSGSIMVRPSGSEEI